MAPVIFQDASTPVELKSRLTAVYKTLLAGASLCLTGISGMTVPTTTTRIEVESGIHAYTTLRAAKDDDAVGMLRTPVVAIVQAVIPKGARYYIGQCDDIVSDSLLIYPPYISAPAGVETLYIDKI